MGAGSIAVTADRDARRYRTTVNAPAGWTLTIGHTLPPGASVASVALDERPADYAIRDTIRWPRGARRNDDRRAASAGHHGSRRTLIHRFLR
jgi:hypothetical protein